MASFVSKFAGQALIVLIALTPASAEEADPNAPGQVRSTSFAAFSPERGLTVRPLDDSDANMRLKLRFADALSRREVRVQEPPAPVALNFETEVQEVARRGDDAYLGEATQASNRESQVRISMWSTTQDSVLQGRRLGAARGTHRYILIATLDDERTGERLWQGEASYAGAPADEAAALAAMVPILAEQLGRTVRHRSFWLE